MKINLDIPLQFKGIVTVEAHTAEGELLHREVQDNLIVSTGFGGLVDTLLGDELLKTCILGRNTTAPALGDLFLGPGSGSSFTELYNPDCPDDPPGTACALAPVRSIVARSTSNGGTADVYDRSLSAPYYWRLTRKRVFTRHVDYFMAGNSSSISGTCAVGSAAWALDGWGSLDKEASFIGEVGFCSGVVEPRKYVRECVTVPEWSADPANDGRLWNRIALGTTIGFESATPYATPDVILPTTGVITVTLELRAYFSIDATVQVVDVDGTPTTVSTRVQERDRAGYWAEGFLRRFGYWRGDGRAATAGESNTLPPTDQGYFPDGSSVQVSSAWTDSSGPNYIVRKYRFNAGIANWSGGIGGMIHCNSEDGITDAHIFCTVFNPKIPKTALERLEIEIRYTWEQYTT